MHGERDSLAALETLGTTDISDALDRLGIAGQCAGIMPLSRAFRLVGRAFTVRYAAVGIAGGTVGDYIDDVGEGDVVVLDNNGRLDATVWGDILTSTAARNRISGTVIDGICRDIDRSIELAYPIYARGNWMRTGKDRVCVEATNAPVTIGGVRVDAGDFLLGDGDGVVAIPLARAHDVIEAAKRIRETEDTIREMVSRGMPLREARSETQYHSLQSRVTS